MICRICRVGDINFSTHSISFCLSSSPPSLSLPPPFISHLQFLADLPPSLKSLWISGNFPHSAAMDELILTLCCCRENRWACERPSVLPTHSLVVYDRFIKYYTSTPKKGSPNNTKIQFPLWAWRFRWEHLCFLQQERQRDFFSVTTNWETTCLVLFVQPLVTHRPEYSQRSDVRQSKQDRLFHLIRVLIVIDLLSFLQTEI